MHTLQMYQDPAFFNRITPKMNNWSLVIKTTLRSKSTNDSAKIQCTQTQRTKTKIIYVVSKLITNTTQSVNSSLNYQVLFIKKLEMQTTTKKRTKREKKDGLKTQPSGIPISNDSTCRNIFKTSFLKYKCLNSILAEQGQLLNQQRWCFTTKSEKQRSPHCNACFKGNFYPCIL